jgi:hypothetical protein
VISERVRASGDVLLVAPVRGLESEVPALLGALESFAPEAVGVGLSEDELAGIRRYFVASEAEPIVPLTSNEANEVRGLARFGPVRVPNPSYVELLGWADARGVPVAALDPSEDASASLFAEHIGYVELVRRTVKERSVGRSPPVTSTADEFALAWDRVVAGGKGSRAFARSRDAHLAEGARRLGAARSRIAVVVDRERFALVRELLAGRGS